LQADAKRLSALDTPAKRKKSEDSDTDDDREATSHGGEIKKPPKRKRKKLDAPTQARPDNQLPPRIWNLSQRSANVDDLLNLLKRRLLDMLPVLLDRLHSTRLYSSRLNSHLSLCMEKLTGRTSMLLKTLLLQARLRCLE
jgi:hypothetical protein